MPTVIRALGPSNPSAATCPKMEVTFDLESHYDTQLDVADDEVRSPKESVSSQ